MNTPPETDLSPPRFVESPALLVTGLAQRYARSGDPAMPMQWQRFAPHIGHVSGQKGAVAFGVCANYDNDGGFDYIAGVEVSDFSDLPKDFTTIRIPEHRYAVFTHRGHVSSIPATFAAIWRQWLPASGHKIADAPMFERYDERFDPNTGDGEVEIWLPLER